MDFCKINHQYNFTASHKECKFFKIRSVQNAQFVRNSQDQLKSADLMLQFQTVCVLTKALQISTYVCVHFLLLTLSSLINIGLQINVGFEKNIKTHSGKRYVVRVGKKP